MVENHRFRCIAAGSGRQQRRKGAPGANSGFLDRTDDLDADLTGIADRIPWLGFATMEACLLASTPAPDPPLRMFLNPRS